MDLFREQYLNQWPVLAELHRFAEQVCAAYDLKCDTEEAERGRCYSAWRFQKEVVAPTYTEALRLGFEGDAHAWSRYVFEHRPREERERS